MPFVLLCFAIGHFDADCQFISVRKFFFSLSSSGSFRASCLMTIAIHNFSLFCFQKQKYTRITSIIFISLATISFARRLFRWFVNTKMYILCDGLSASYVEMNAETITNSNEKSLFVEIKLNAREKWKKKIVRSTKCVNEFAMNSMHSFHFVRNSSIWNVRIVVGCHRKRKRSHSLRPRLLVKYRDETKRKCRKSSSSSSSKLTRAASARLE